MRRRPAARPGASTGVARRARRSTARSGGVRERLRYRSHACREHNGRRQRAPAGPLWLQISSPFVPGRLVAHKAAAEGRFQACSRVQHAWMRYRVRDGVMRRVFGPVPGGAGPGPAAAEAQCDRNRSVPRPTLRAADPACPRDGRPGRDPHHVRTPYWERSRARAIIRTREGPGRLERARTPGPDPAGGPSAASEGIRPS